MSFQEVCGDQDSSFDIHLSGQNNSSCAEEAQRPSENVGSHLENMDRPFAREKNPAVKLRGSYLCPFCPKIFSYKSILDFHVGRFHPNAFSTSSSHKDKMPETSPRFPQKKRVSFGFYRKRTRSNISLPRKKKTTFALQNFSSFCSTSLQNHSTLNPNPTQQNLATQMHAHFFQCSLCEYKTDHKPTFDRHNLKHTINCFECNQCQMPFLRKENLLTHLKLKHSETETTPSRSVQLQCPHCQYSTSFKSVMNRHLLKHDLATLACDICQMPFINKANIYSHMKLKHPNESAALLNGTEKVLHQCPFCSYSNSIHSKVTRHMRIQHRRERYECKVCELFLPSELALEEHIRQNHFFININANGSDQFKMSPNVSLPVDNAPVDQCFYCPYCLNRLDNRSFLIQTDVSNYVCPTCNMAFSRQLLLGQDIQTFESKEPIFTREESFSNFPDSTEETHNLSDVQLLEEIYVQSENLQSDINVQSKDGLDNRARPVDQTDRINSIDFIEIDDDDDDDAERIDVDANESLHYPHVLHCNSNDKDATPNVCIEETHFPDKDNEHDPLIGDSPNDTLPTPGPSTSLEQSNSISKRGRWVKLVSDFDDFAERPFACALCYQRYSEFNQLSVHVKNHLTGAGGYDAVQTMASPW